MDKLSTILDVKGLQSPHEGVTFRGWRVGTEDVPTLVYCTTTQKEKKPHKSPFPKDCRAVPRDRGISKGEREPTRLWIKKRDVEYG